MLRPGGRLVVTTPNRRTFPPGNPFHSRELDAAELARLVGRRTWTSTRCWGCGTAPRLAADDARLGDLVDAQVTTAPDLRDDDLQARVAAVSAADFDLDDRDLDGCLDLVLTAVRR